MRCPFCGDEANRVIDTRLARDGEELFAVEASGVLATSFHPELSDNTALHARFLSNSGLE